MHELTIRSESVAIKFKMSGELFCKFFASNALLYIAVIKPIRIFIDVCDIRQLKCVPQNDAKRLAENKPSEYRYGLISVPVLFSEFCRNNPLNNNGPANPDISDINRNIPMP